MSTDHSNKPSGPLPVTAQPIVLSELSPLAGRAADGGSRAAPLVAGSESNPLRNVKVKLTVCVGAAELTVGELLGSGADHVICLDRQLEEPVDLMLEGQVVARGVLMAVDDRFALRITELPRALDLPLAGTGHRDA